MYPDSIAWTMIKAKRRWRLEFDSYLFRIKYAFSQSNKYFLN